MGFLSDVGVCARQAFLDEEPFAVRSGKRAKGTTRLRVPR